MNGTNPWNIAEVAEFVNRNLLTVNKLYNIQQSKIKVQEH